MDRKSQKIEKIIRIRQPASTPIEARCTKNIVKNFGKAICSFATTPSADMYIDSYIEEKKLVVSKSGFKNYASVMKKICDSIDGFKSVFMGLETDDSKVKDYKALLRLIGEVFIKYFSVNWIYSGKMMYKYSHLRFRFKILRRVRNPELFQSLISSKRRNLYEY